jgi:CheY-like chemotaxis protein
MSARTSSEPTGKILVVDRDEFNVRILKRILEHDGYQVFAAANILDALAIAQHEHPDLIILETFYGGESVEGYAWSHDGVNLMEMFHSMEEIKDTPILFTTAGKLGYPGTIERVMNSRAAGYFELPVNREPLLQAVHAALR